MSPDEVISLLKKMDISVSRGTLCNWEKWGMIPSPVFRNGRVTTYPPETLIEAYAAWKMKNGTKRLTVAQIKSDRKKALTVSKEQIVEEIKQGKLENCTALEWLAERDRAMQIINSWQITRNC